MYTMQGVLLWEQLSYNITGHMVFVVFRPSSRHCLENTSADNTLFDWSIKTGVVRVLMVLYEWHCGTVGPHRELMGKHESGSPWWTISDSFMMEIGHDCPVTGAWSLFLSSCLLIIVRNEVNPVMIWMHEIAVHGCNFSLCDGRDAH